jgi:hypothetical protein
MARAIGRLVAFAMCLVGTVVVGDFARGIFGWFGYALWLVVCFWLGCSWGRIFYDALRSRERRPL